MSSVQEALEANSNGTEMEIVCPRCKATSGETITVSEDEEYDAECNACGYVFTFTIEDATVH